MRTDVLIDTMQVLNREITDGDLPPDPFERSDLVDHALVLAGGLIGWAQRLRAEREPYVTTYSVEERLAHRRAALEPPKDPPNETPPTEPVPPAQDDPPPSQTPSDRGGS